ncbi:tRNA (uracil-5-)-methyltransferase homolog B-like isoform X2 [Haemaphysalis longicornis]
MDVSAQAIEAATHNAQLSGFSNARYQVGQAEMLLPELRGQFLADDLCIIVNTGQAGLSCAANLPQAGKVGVPFRLLLACPVDRFPRTQHCELLLLLGQ